MQTKEQLAAYARAWRKKNAAKYSEVRKSYYERNKEKIIAQVKKSYIKRKDKIREYQSEYYSKNWMRWYEKEPTPEQKARKLVTQNIYYKNNYELIRIRDNAQHKVHYQKNKAYYIEKSDRRKQRLRGPDWLTIADKAEIQGLYDFCKIFKGFEVDHIIPLNGKLVSGLHVPSNLQVLPVSENRRKRNNFEVNNHG